MKIVIGGGGKVGEALLSDLQAENHDIFLIENNEQVLSHLLNKYDVIGVEGSVIDYDMQEEADVAHSDLFFAVTSSDELNIIAAIIARKLGAKHTIARVRNPQYGKHFSFVKESLLGITLMINPELETAKEIIKLLNLPHALNVESFAHGRVHLVERIVYNQGELDQLPLYEFRKRYPSLIVCAVTRGDEVIIPDGDFVLCGGDHILLTGRVSDLQHLYRNSDGVNRSIHRVLLIGGGNISHYICKHLDRSNKKITIIEKDREKARKLAGEFSKVTVINADGTDYNVLEELDFSSFDCVVCLTGLDEENILISMYAAKKQINRIITKVNRTQMLPILDNVGLQTIITPKRIIADHILRFTRALANAEGSNINAVYRLFNNRVEALDFVVKDNSHVVDIPLKDLRTKSQVLIAFIMRKGEIIFPTGDDVIKRGDHIIVITTETTLHDLDDIVL